MSEQPPEGKRQLPALLHPRSVTMSTSLVASVDSLAHRKEVSRSAVVRMAVVAYLRGEGVEVDDE